MPWSIVSIRRSSRIASHRFARLFPKFEALLFSTACGSTLDMTRFVFCLLLFSLSLGLLSREVCGEEQRSDVPTPRVIEYPWMDLEKWRWFHTEDLKRAGEGDVDVLFLGDSITECWDTRGLEIWNERLAPLKAANFGIGGDTTQNVLWRITEGGALEGISPRVIVLMIGTNNIGLHKDPPEKVARGVRAILAELQKKFPDSVVLLHAIFPRGKTPGDPMRQTVVQTNRLLEKFGELASVNWVPLWDVFLDAEGNLPARIMPDALHPNAKGYKIWADEVVPVIEATLARTP